MAVEEKKLYSNIFIISYTSDNIIDDVLKCANTKIKILCYEILKFPKSVFSFHRDSKEDHFGSRIVKIG